jgi:hypothetical protein
MAGGSVVQLKLRPGVPLTFEATTGRPRFKASTITLGETQRSCTVRAEVDSGPTWAGLREKYVARAGSADVFGDHQNHVLG